MTRQNYSFRLEKSLLQRLVKSPPALGEDTNSAVFRHTLAWSIAHQDDLFLSPEQLAQQIRTVWKKSTTKENHKALTTCALDESSHAFLQEKSVSLNVSESALLSYLVEAYLAAPEEQKTDFRAQDLAQQSQISEHTRTRLLNELAALGYLQCDLARD